MSNFTPTEIELIPVADINVDDEFNVRKSLGGIDSLSESISALGIQTPLGVHRKRSGNVSLVFGFRRIAAAAQAGLDSVPCIVYPERTPVKDLLMFNMQENVTRDSLNPMEEAEGAMRLTRKGFEEDEICSALGWSKTLLTQRLALLDLSDHLQEALRVDRVSVNQARAINDLPEDRHERFSDMAYGLTTSKLKEMVDRELEKIERSNNPEPIDEIFEEEDDIEIAVGDDGPDGVMLASSVIAGMSDIVAHAYDTSVSDSDSDRANAIITVKSIDWQALALDDLEALQSLVADLVETLQCEGASDPTIESDAA